VLFAAGCTRQVHLLQLIVAASAREAQQQKQQNTKSMFGDAPCKTGPRNQHITLLTQHSTFHFQALLAAL
jgi:hypothetical protein